MKRNVFSVVTVISLLLASCAKNESVSYYQPIVAVDSSHATVSKILEYNPAPGQFMNEAYGSQEQAMKIANDTTFSTMVSLGAWGGSITFKFDHSVENKDGADLAIYGNPPTKGYDEPGIVMVSQDVNNNGIADDVWYELAGSQYDSTATIHNYKVTYYNPNGSFDIPWKDNQGNNGVVTWNSFHSANFYPLTTSSPNFESNKDSITFEGSLLRNTVDLSGWGSNNVGLISWWGYSDSYSLGTGTDTLDNYKSNGYNSFDIDWARKDDKTKVNLPYIDFVKVYTGQLANVGANGEISTEFKGAKDLHISKL